SCRHIVLLMPSSKTETIKKGTEKILNKMFKANIMVTVASFAVFNDQHPVKCILILVFILC
ncbi:MAG: hypothetical protein AAGD92_17055, partial [Pseudomonadota bacterium]